jgi:hypothetical protein
MVYNLFAMYVGDDQFLLGDADGRGGRFRSDL